jgi:hypothetical protein
MLFYTSASSSLTEKMRLSSVGNLGVGVNPSTIIHASRNSGLSTGTGTTVALRLEDTGQDGGAGTWSTTQQFTAVEFYSADASGVGASVRASVGATMQDGNGGSSALTFFTNSSGTNTERGRFTSDGIFRFNSGYGSVANAYGCRVWANVYGGRDYSTQINASGNGSSFVRNSTGNYTLNFVTAMPDINYSAVAAQESGSITFNSLIIPYTYLAGSLQVITLNNDSSSDFRLGSIAIFR